MSNAEPTGVPDETGKNPVSETLELGTPPPKPLWRRRNWIIAALLLILVIAASRFSNRAPAIEYETATAVRDDLLIYVTATGALEPTNQVEVGIEVSGTIATVEVDFNDQIEAGQVLARLDTAKLAARVLQARATLESARARLLTAQARSTEASNEYARLQEVRELSGGRVPSQSDLDRAQATLLTAQADETASKAAIAEAEALLGRHNHQNAAAAYAACHALGVAPGRIMAAIRSFPGLPHRMELVGEVEGVRFVNDSKATNAQAAEQALKTWSKVHWIAGGVPKAEGIEPLKPWFDRVTQAYLIGESEAGFAKTLNGKAETVKCGTLEAATQAAFDAAKASGEPHPIVLLSPACASFDQFKDFEARGDAFRDIVQRLAAQVTPQKEAV